jgi:hypothetical protein
MIDASDYQSFAVVSEILKPSSVWDADLHLAQRGSILFKSSWSLCCINKTSLSRKVNFYCYGSFNITLITNGSSYLRNLTPHPPNHQELQLECFPRVEKTQAILYLICDHLTLVSIIYQRNTIKFGPHRQYKVNQYEVDLVRMFNVATNNVYSQTVF